MSNRTDEEIEGIVRDIMGSDIEAHEFVNQLHDAMDELEKANAKIKKYEELLGISKQHEMLHAKIEIIKKYEEIIEAVEKTKQSSKITTDQALNP